MAAHKDFDPPSAGDHRRAEMDLARLSILPRLNPNPVAEVDQDGNVALLNAAARRLFPDLYHRHQRHPWLQDWPPAQRAPCAREIAIGERWYRQDIQWMESTQTFLIHGVDITEFKLAQAALRESEGRVRMKLHSILSPEGDLGTLELADIIETSTIQKLCGDFHALTQAPLAVIDEKGGILAGAGLQDICTRFHRVHPETCRNCLASGTQLSEGIPPGDYRLYQCKNNMWEAAAPIVIGGRRVGSLHCGQFFFADKKPDRDFFKAQAKRHGFPQKDYLAALERVPLRTRDHMNATMRFVSNLAQSLSQSSWKNFCLARSVAEGNQREKDLRLLNRTLTARSRSDAAMFRAKDEVEIAKETCNIIMEACGYALVWIGYAEQDENKTVRVVAGAGDFTAYLENISVSWGQSEGGRGPVGTAIREGKPSICQNTLSDPMFMPWRQQALKIGLGSAVALPLRTDDKTFGVIAVYSRDPDAFTQEEVSMLSSLADELAYGIGALRMRQARQHAEAHFQQAQKMEAVGLLAGGIAHDFNNILAIIMGYNDAVLDELKPGHRLRAYCQEIKHSCEVGGTLTHQLLGIGGHHGGQDRVLDPNSVILQMTKMLRRVLPENVRLEIKLHSSIWPVKLASGQLEQIVLNLAVNARDAMPQGGRLTITSKNLTVKTAQDAKATLPTNAGDYVALEIRDTGTGMEPEVLTRLFDAFFTTKGPGRGTGLGLSIVQSIIKDHAGHISVESQLGRGSVFRIYMPSAKGSANPLLSKASARNYRRGQGSILIVEDNTALRTLIKMALRRSGYTAYTAGTSEEALSICGKIRQTLDLLLTDVVLPDENGIELAKRVKELRPGIRTVYMTGYPGNALGPISGSGHCVILEKPFSLGKLLKTMREMMASDQGDYV
jgi:signal transduction histidine kinase/CheY-like chemotaxis protein/ligand-binding sensor protein